MQKTILYAVLNWGLGHATRSIPILQALIAKNYKLIIVSDGEALNLLKSEFPQLTYETTQAYGVVYASNAKKFNATLALQIPKFIQAIKDEHSDCKKHCKQYQVDYIISDNRYGFYHDQIPSAFIGHQLQLRYPANRFFEKIVNKSYQSYLKKFSELWVPDLAPPMNISGELSNLAWKNVRFLGIASRLEKMDIESNTNYLAILSGPEPQRTLLEEELLIKLPRVKGKHILVRGTSTPRTFAPNKNIGVFDMLTTRELNQLICASKTVICRSGYTSIMDLLKLDKNALLIPTPGQAEQEYLAENLKKLNYFSIQKQGFIQLDSLKKTYRPKLTFGYDFTIIQSFLSC